MPRNQCRQAVFSMAGLFANPIPTRFLATVDCLKNPTQMREGIEPDGKMVDMVEQKMLSEK
jgi:hypothetical protein